MKNKKLSLLLILPLLVTACNKTPTGSSPNNSGPVVSSPDGSSPVVSSPTSPDVSTGEGPSTSLPDSSDPTIPPEPDFGEEDIALRPTVPFEVDELAQIQKELSHDVDEDGYTDVITAPLYYMFKDESNEYNTNLLFVDDLYAYLVSGYDQDVSNFEIGKYYDIIGCYSSGYSYLGNSQYDYFRVSGDLTLIAPNSDHANETAVFKDVWANDYNFISPSEEMTFRPVKFKNLILKDKSQLASTSYMGKYITAIDPITGEDINISIDSTILNFKDTSNALNSINVGDVFSAEVLYIGANAFALIGMPNELVKENNLTDAQIVEYAKKMVAIPSSVIRPVELPSLINGVSITWKSSDSTIISPLGMVYPSTKEQKVSLEATFSYKGVNSKVTYNVTVPQSQNLTSSTYFDYSGLNNNGNSAEMNGERVKDYSNLHFYGKSIISTISVDGVYAGDNKNGLGLKLGSNSKPNPSITYHFDTSISEVYLEIKRYTPTEDVKVTIDNYETYSVTEDKMIIRCTLRNAKRDLKISSQGKALISYMIVVQ